MNDGLFVIPILNADNIIMGWGRGDTIVPNAARYKDAGIDIRFLRYVDGSVVEISDEDKAAIIAADELAKQKYAEEIAAKIEAEANAPFEVSKYKLSLFFMQNGKLDDFMSFINTDATRTFLWNAAQVLDSDNPMVLTALSEISGLLPEGITATDLLKQCKA